MDRLDVRLHRKINSILDKHLIFVRQARVSNKDFSIICNNCWGGYVYRRYGLPYLSPTIGLYLFADDYVKFCHNLKVYLAKELAFISYTESRHREVLEMKKQTEVPIARLGDIEIIFLHYATPEEAAEKWKRRTARINYSNLIFKFSQMNECSEEHLMAFDQLDVAKKFCFVPAKSASMINCGIRFKSADGNEIRDDTSEYSRYINLTKMINAKSVCGKRMEGQWEKR